MKIFIIHNDNYFKHVRGRKFLQFFNSQGYDYHLYYWKRIKPETDSSLNSTVLLKGGGYGSKILILLYFCWVIKVFFYFLIKKIEKNTVFLVIDFDSALPIYLVKLLRHDINYIYDLHDDFSMRYKWIKPLKSVVSGMDRLVRDKAEKVIHVDESRVGPGDKNYIIIHNTPSDFVEKEKPVKKVKKNSFVVSGLLSNGRGIESVYQFALANRDLNFIIAGNVAANNNYDKLFELPHVEFLGYVPQDELFRRIYGASGIFSLYDPSLEINRLAASNKLYDAMMLGIPVISNFGIISEKFIIENKIGVCVSYDFDDTWDILSSREYLADLEHMGESGRKLYLEKFSFENNYIEKLKDLMSNLIN